MAFGVAIFRIRLDTAFDVAASDADLSSTVKVVHAAGGADVSVFQNDGHGRAEFSLEAHDRGQAARAVQGVLLALTEAVLTEAAPSPDGGWVVASISGT